MDRRKIVNNRLVSFIAGLAAVGVATAVYVIGQKLSQDSLALLVGLTCGVGAMFPTIGLAGFVIYRDDRKRKTQQQAQPVQPPVIVVAPQAALPGAGQGYYGQPQPPIYVEDGWGHSRSSGRDFQMVGTDD